MASAPYNPLGDPMKETNNNKSEPLPKHRPTTKQITAQQEPGQPRANRAVEAARRVGGCGGGLIVAALNVGGLRAGAGTYSDGCRQRAPCGPRR